MHQAFFPYSQTQASALQTIFRGSTGLRLYPPGSFSLSSRVTRVSRLSTFFPCIFFKTEIMQIILHARTTDEDHAQDMGDVAANSLALAREVLIVCCIYAITLTPSGC